LTTVYAAVKLSSHVRPSGELTDSRSARDAAREKLTAAAVARIKRLDLCMPFRALNATVSQLIFVAATAPMLPLNTAKLLNTTNARLN